MAVPTTLSPTQMPMSQLALELIAKLEPIQNVLIRHNLTEPELKKLLKEPAFKQQIKEAKQYWDSPSNLRERVQAKTGMLIEDSVMEMYTLIHDSDLNPAARLDAFKTLARMANMEDPQKKEVAQLRQTGEGASKDKRVMISINLGGEDSVHCEVPVHPPQVHPHTVGVHEIEAAEEVEFIDDDS